MVRGVLLSPKSNYWDLEITKENKMKTKDVKAILAKMSGIAPKSSTMPIIETVLISSGDKTAFTATNLEIFMQLDVEESGEPFDICVNYDKLKKLVGKLSSDEITFGYKADTVELLVNSGNAKYSIKGFMKDEFPPMKTHGDFIMAFDNKEFMKDYDFINLATSKDEARPVLMGTLLELDESLGTVVFAGTDGFRIHTTKAKHTVVETKTLLLPPSLKYLKVANGEVTAYYNSSIKVIVFMWDGGRISMPEIEGAYPNYQAIIPKETRFSFLAESKDVAEACESAGIIAVEGTETIRLDFLSDNLDNVVVSSKSEEMGTVEIDVPIVNSTLHSFDSNDRDESGNFSVAYHWKFLKDVVGVGETIMISMNGNRYPTVIISPETERMIVLMPKHL
jgi:DNA polymerase III subunit beta